MRPRPPVPVERLPHSLIVKASYPVNPARSPGIQGPLRSRRDRLTMRSRRDKVAVRSRRDEVAVRFFRLVQIPVRTSPSCFSGTASLTPTF